MVNLTTVQIVVVLVGVICTFIGRKIGIYVILRCIEEQPDDWIEAINNYKEEVNTFRQHK